MGRKSWREWLRFSYGLLLIPGTAVATGVVRKSSNSDMFFGGERINTKQFLHCMFGVYKLSEW